jgi:hypothetical protein
MKWRIVYTVAAQKDAKKLAVSCLNTCQLARLVARCELRVAGLATGNTQLATVC